MDDQIIALFCLIDDLLKAMRDHDGPQCQTSDAEVMTVALVAALSFGGNWSQACRWLTCPQYMPAMLSKSRFNRRLHRVKPLFLTVFACLGDVWKELNVDSTYSIDTFFIPACSFTIESRWKHLAV